MEKWVKILSYVLIGALALMVFMAVYSVRFTNNGNRTKGVLYADNNLNSGPEGCDGIDVSHHQGIIDWRKVGSSVMLQFVYVKATEGSTHVDKYFERNFNGARRAGLRVGAYHFLTSQSSVVAQFLNFYEHASPQSLDLLPVVDVEWSGVEGWSTAQLQDSLSLFVHLVKEYYGHTPIIYADAQFFRQHLSGRFNDYPLFIAHYNSSQPQLEGVSRHYLWQRDEHGRVPGISKDVDLDAFANGTTIEDILMTALPK